MNEQTEKEAISIQGIATQLCDTYGFDSLFIIATKRGDRSTESMHGISGNYFATYGAVNDWLLREDTKTQNSIE